MAPVAPIPCFAAKDKSGKLDRWQYEPQPLGDGDIEIRVTYNGLCHSDVHVTRSEWGKVSYPMVPGHEIVGVVTQTGSSVSHLKEGDTVGFGWFKNCCQQCNACVTGNDNVCPKAKATIMGGSNGGFAERFRGSGNLAVKIPDSMKPQDAAPLLCAGITVWSPIAKYVTKPGMKVGVVGLGGLGHLALQFLSKAVGAEVFAISHSPNKKPEAMKLGAHHFVGLDEVPDNTLDVILNTTPGGMDAKKMVQKLGYNGCLVYLGGGTDEIKLVAFDLIPGQKQVVGSCVGGRAQMREMFHIAALHDIRPIIEVLPLEKCNEAIDKLMAGDARYRIVLETGDAFQKSNL